MENDDSRAFGLYVNTHIHTYSTLTVLGALSMHWWFAVCISMKPKVLYIIYIFKNSEHIALTNSKAFVCFSTIQAFHFPRALEFLHTKANNVCGNGWMVKYHCIQPMYLYLPNAVKDYWNKHIHRYYWWAIYSSVLYHKTHSFH